MSLLMRMFGFCDNRDEVIENVNEVVVEEPMSEGFRIAVDYYKFLTKEIEFEEKKNQNSKNLLIILELEENNKYINVLRRKKNELKKLKEEGENIKQKLDEFFADDEPAYILK